MGHFLIFYRNSVYGYFICDLDYDTFPSIDLTGLYEIGAVRISDQQMTSQPGMWRASFPDTT